MKKNILISIIVPVFNVEKYLENCMKSIIKQTYKNIEIILVDDGSTDNSGKICDMLAKKDKRIKVYHKINGGLADARNFGIGKATGEYVTFIDSDDDITEEYIEYLFGLLNKNNTEMSIGAYSVVTNNKIINIGDGYVEEVLIQVEAIKRLLCEEGYTVSSCAKMYSKDLFSDIKFPKGKICEDNGTTYKLIMKCDKIAYGNKSIYNYYKRENSIMTSKFNLRKLDLIDLSDQMCQEIVEKFPELYNYTEKKKITARFSILRQMLVSNLSQQEKIEEKKIEKYLKKRAKYILDGKQFEKREKIAMLALLLGKRFYAFAWKIYCKIKY